ncbi:MAG: hypothetical protein WCK90_04465 [archaeon]
MKKQHSKTQAKEKIESFFKKSSFSQEEMRKIKRLAMKYNLKLKNQKSRFCKKCLSPLAGKIRISKNKSGIFKTIECSKCGYKNKNKI